MRVLWQDALFAVGICLYLGVGFITKMAIAQVASVEGYAEFATELEANPIARQTMNFRYGFLVLQWSAIAILSGVYYAMRRQYKLSTGANREINYNTLGIFVTGLFFVFLQNIMNDLPILIGLLGM